MYCKYCGKEISDNSDFCPYCGKKIKNENNYNSKVKQTNEKSINEDEGIKGSEVKKEFGGINNIIRTKVQIDKKTKKKLVPLLVLSTIIIATLIVWDCIWWRGDTMNLDFLPSTTQSLGRYRDFCCYKVSIINKWRLSKYSPVYIKKDGNRFSICKDVSVFSIDEVVEDIKSATYHYDILIQKDQFYPVVIFSDRANGTIRWVYYTR